MEDVELVFEEKALEFIVEKALEFKLGARGLRSICEAILVDAMFELPSKKDEDQFIVTAEYAESKLEKSGLKKLKAAS
jgi:ATP-dependent Clp protease ATP-binding subunit ClpX